MSKRANSKRRPTRAKPTEERPGPVKVRKIDGTPADEKPAPTKKAPTAVAERHACACGCDQLTRRTWAPGHDARFHAAVGKVRKGELESAELLRRFSEATVQAHAPDLVQ